MVEWFPALCLKSLGEHRTHDKLIHAFLVLALSLSPFDQPPTDLDLAVRQSISDHSARKPLRAWERSRRGLEPQSLQACLGIIEFVKDNDHLLRRHHNGFVETEATAMQTRMTPALARSGAGPERDVIWILARESPMTSRLAAP